VIHTDYDRWFPEGVSYSWGGGVQSTALLVLVAQGYLPRGPFLFANVGDDSEHPGTLEFVRGPAWDYAERHGIHVEELHRIPQRGPHAGTPETLYGRLMRPGSRSLPIPVRMSDTGAPGTRSCTADFKVRVVGRWVQEHGATEARPVRVGIGISTDEYQRAKSRRRDAPWEDPWYPLLDMEHRYAVNGGLDRSACGRIIVDAGLPLPPKSSCYFCPFHKPTVWNDMARDEPDLFEKSCHLEETLIARRATRPCGGAGRWPIEATQGIDRDAFDHADESPPAATYRTGFTPADGQGACPSCRSRQPVEVVDGEWVMAAHMKGPVYLTRFGKPLRSVFGPESAAGVQGSLLAPGWDADEGYRCGDVCDT